MDTLTTKIFKIRSEEEFTSTAIEVFRYQYERCAVYHQWVDLLGVLPEHVQHVDNIPALPIEIFKNKTVVSFRGKPTDYFQSSGTTNMAHSHHYFRTLRPYDRSLKECFRLFWGDPEQYCIVALLPNYLHQGHSSLIHMMQILIEETKCPRSGFYDEITPELRQLLHRHKKTGRKLILFGVSYALLDIVKHWKIDLSDAIVFETGGMKGRRKEMVKQQLHEILKKGFNIDAIASEYGMCELFSQAYSRGEGLFLTPPWMKIRIRDTHSPLHLLPAGRSGGIDVIDLANIDTCSFISTQDLGKLHPKDKESTTDIPQDLFEILGRFDDSDIRGCNLMSEMQ